MRTRLTFLICSVVLTIVFVSACGTSDSSMSGLNDTTVAASDSSAVTQSTSTSAAAGQYADIAAAVSQVSFRVFYLGPSFKGVPLRGAKVWGTDPAGAARVDVIYDGSESGGSSDAASPAVVTLLESSASCPGEISDVERGLAASGKTAEEITKNGRTYRFWSGENAWPTLVFQRNGTLIVVSVSEDEGARKLLLEAADSLVEVAE